ncbi:MULTISPECIES: DUF6177 family protein [Streptomyces]|uniref:DUF6177 family protein n=1 Tax=Streptomyces TaxID=1883 RepID=UPI000CF26772|nr:MULTISPECIES: DUF6177 family protein [Streptomyces]PPS68959.1 hypothetical protein BV882_29380 [Streptomyces sp. 46]
MATLRVLRTLAGVEEDITLALGYGGDETPTLDAVEGLATALAADHGLVTLLKSLRSARHDLTVRRAWKPRPPPSRSPSARA